MGSVAVFCAASESIDSCYVSAAREVGAMLARLGVTLVYGGARFGLMEATLLELFHISWRSVAG